MTSSSLYTVAEQSLEESSKVERNLRYTTVVNSYDSVRLGTLENTANPWENYIDLRKKFAECDNIFLQNLSLNSIVYIYIYIS